MRLRKKKSLIEQAADYVEAVKPQIGSAVVSARGSAKDFVEGTALPALADARDKAAPYVADARDKAASTLADARDKAGPALSDARDKAAPYVVDARDKAATGLADARDKAAPYVTAGAAAATARTPDRLSEARGKAAPYLADARDRASCGLSDAKVKAAPYVAAGTAAAAAKAGTARTVVDARLAQLTGKPAPKKGAKLKKVALFALVAAAVGVVAKKLQGGQDDSWQSSYVPAPAPGPVKPPATRPTAVPPVPASPAATAGTPAAEEAAEDAGGASPDEALADSVESTHPITTPDQPAVVFPIDGAAPEDEPTDPSRPSI